MRRQETKTSVYPLTREQRSTLQMSIEKTGLVWAYHPHPLQAKYMGMLLWQLDGEHNISTVQSHLVDIMGILMLQTSIACPMYPREDLLVYHRTLSNLFSLLQNMLTSDAVFTYPA